MKHVFAMAALVLFATPALAGGQIPDGTYQCYMDGYLNGEMVISDNTYKGPNYDGKYDGTFTFAVGGDNGITFNGPIGLYSDPSLQFLGGRLVESAGKPAIELHVKSVDSANVHIAVCSIE